MYPSEYSNYIGSSDWNNKKREALAFHGRVCGRCYSKRDLDVHHIHYGTFKNEDIRKDLSVLCRLCHNEYHSLYEMSINKNTFKKFMRLKLPTPTKKVIKNIIKKPRLTEEQKIKRKKTQAAIKAQKVDFNLEKARSYFEKTGEIQSR